ncbi:hypothetical protein [Streptomyces sp. NPDC017941]|uniref:hypothetical protein n=1 Tax=Streptomyces sp. NPDC017941 TaxID=3365018 RepID=UPI0037A8DD85
MTAGVGETTGGSVTAGVVEDEVFGRGRVEVRVEVRGGAWVWGWLWRMYGLRFRSQVWGGAARGGREWWRPAA